MFKVVPGGCWPDLEPVYPASPVLFPLYTFESPLSRWDFLSTAVGCWLAPKTAGSTKN